MNFRREDMYKSTDKMSLLMGAGTPKGSTDSQVLQLIHRFGIPLGVGDKTIEQVCQEANIDCHTLLTVVHFAMGKEYHHEGEIHIPTLRLYLENAHLYFMSFQLPRIRQMLLEAINLAGSDNKIPLLIIRMYDEYMEEIRTHIQHENEQQFEYHPTDDQHVAAKATELKNLIIKYYPNNNKISAQAQEQERLLYAVLHDLHHFENELALHCAIEDEIMLPALSKESTTDTISSYKLEDSKEELSNREKDVLIQIVNGLSNKEIADVLHLSTHTVMSHRKNIARKLNIHSTAGLTIYAIVNGIVEVF
jgi:regulator of cell morphogenesis and NO signaling